MLNVSEEEGGTGEEDELDDLSRNSEEGRRNIMTLAERIHKCRSWSDHELGWIRRELENGADVHEADSKGYTALHYASWGKTELVELPFESAGHRRQPDG